MEKELPRHVFVVDFLEGKEKQNNLGVVEGVCCMDLTRVDCHLITNFRNMIFTFSNQRRSKSKEAAAIYLRQACVMPDDLDHLFEAW